MTFEDKEQLMAFGRYTQQQRRNLQRYECGECKVIVSSDMVQRFTYWANDEMEMSATKCPKCNGINTVYSYDHDIESK